MAYEQAPAGTPNRMRYTLATLKEDLHLAYSTVYSGNHAKHGVRTIKAGDPLVVRFKRGTNRFAPNTPTTTIVRLAVPRADDYLGIYAPDHCDEIDVYETSIAEYTYAPTVVDAIESR